MAESVFVRYGGFASVSRVVSDFYSRMMESDVMRPYFVDVDMARLIDHQTKFFASMMGGPASFSDEHLERVHAHLGITDPAFQELGLLLRETLEDHDFDESDIAAVMSEVVARRPVIVSGV